MCLTSAEANLGRAKEMIKKQKERLNGNPNQKVSSKIAKPQRPKGDN